MNKEVLTNIDICIIQIWAIHVNNGHLEISVCKHIVLGFHLKLLNLSLFTYNINQLILFQTKNLRQWPAIHCPLNRHGPHLQPQQRPSSARGYQPLSLPLPSVPTHRRRKVKHALVWGHILINIINTIFHVLRPPPPPNVT